MFSKVLRRTHMYLALFLSPWLLMYALSTMAMNHRDIFRKAHGPAQPPFVTERETTFTGALPEGTDARAKAAVLLNSLGMDGAHNSSIRNDGTLVINRFDAISPRRILFTPSDGHVLIEKQQFRANAFLERMHRRRGFMQDYAVDDLWAFIVDLVIAAMIFWGLSGIWMWWEMKATRLLGLLAASSGIVIFAFYLAAL